ncbi:MAG: FAD-binding oxidoreductase [Candidatus Eisenbacteria bacterium]|uniref:FAD-binding oxidoreductase n=1 Tax=Eiseniibacteriota bacterium TaxID=2212470 RepID=A0A538TYU2_UNCEI|nr:MAG: FAD-binding oxidoreductase [Candidatus Eisenbacteria bacterium]
MSLALGLGRERAVTVAGYAIGLQVPRVALRPATPEEAAEALRAAAADRLAVVLWGGGTRLRRASPARGYDVALDLGALDRVLEYEPEDLTVTAQCGVTLATLAATLGARGQELPLESPRANDATLGGTLAWNGSGPRRRRFGAPVDRILGARFALSDGTLARAGGKVVKNVAGHPVHRLLCGSRGGLAAIVEASLKLLPAPETRVALVYGLKDWEVADAARWKPLPRLEPSFVTVLGATAARALPAAARVEAPFVAAIGIEEERRWGAEQERAIVAVLGAPTARVEGDAVVALAQALADAEDQDGARLTLTSAHLTPAALAPFVERADAARLVLHAPAGRLHWFPADENATTLALDLHQAGFRVIDTRGPLTFQAPIPPEVAITPLRARIKDGMDPAGILSGAR